MTSSDVETETNRRLITERFAAWSKGDRAPLFDSIADDVRWTVAGSCQGGGTYYSKQDFMTRSSGPVQARLQSPALPHVTDIRADGDTVFVRWNGETKSKAGPPYVQTYCWVMRLRGGEVVEITSYLDTLAVAKLFEH